MSIFSRSTQSYISSPVLLLISAAVASRFLGLLRDRVLAAQFGAGEELDIYFAAFRVPDFLYNAVIAGAIAVALIPVLVQVRKSDTEEGWRVTQNFFNLMAACLGVAALAGFFAMPWLMYVIAPGFSGEKYDMAVQLSRIMMLSPVLLGASAVFSGVNQALHKFFPYAVAPLLYNLGIIAGVVFLVPLWGLAGVAWGVVTGAATHMAAQMLWAWRAGFRFAPLFFPGRFMFGHMIKLMLPRSFGLMASQVNILMMTAIASMLASGSVSVFHLANNLQYLVIGIVGLSYATVALPTFADNWRGSQEQKGAYAQAVLGVVRQILFWVLPLSALLFVLRAHVVRIVLGAGVFGWEDTRLTAAVLGVFCFGLFAHGLIPTLARAFYAAQDTWTPVRHTLIGVALNIFLSMLFAFVFLQDGAAGVVGNILRISDLDNVPLLGLPIAFVLSGTATLALLLGAFFHTYCPAHMRKELQNEMGKSALRITALSIMAGFAAYGALRLILLIPAVATDTFWGIFFQGAGAGIVGMAVYLGAMFFLGLPEKSFIKAFFPLGMRRRATYQHAIFPEDIDKNVY